MGGPVYNILHDIPFTYVDKDGNRQWMMERGGREQLGAEGFIMAALS